MSLKDALDTLMNMKPERVARPAGVEGNVQRAQWAEIARLQDEAIAHEDRISSLEAENARLRQELRLSEDQCNLFAEAFAEIKATDDGESDQPIAAILAGCIEEMKGIKDRYAALAEPTAPR